MCARGREVVFVLRISLFRRMLGAKFFRVIALYRTLPLSTGLCRERKARCQYLDGMALTQQSFSEDDAGAFAEILISGVGDHSQSFVSIFREADLNGFQVQAHLDRLLLSVCSVSGRIQHMQFRDPVSAEIFDDFLRNLAAALSVALDARVMPLIYLKIARDFDSGESALRPELPERRFSRLHNE